LISDVLLLKQRNKAMAKKRKFDWLIGNKHAEKWTIEESTKLFETALQMADEQETITIRQGTEFIEILAYKYDFVGEILRHFDLYKELLGHLTTRFPELDNHRKTLMSKLESNCYYNTKKGLIREATGIVNLKSNHNWTDRQQTDIGGSGLMVTIKERD